MYYINYFFVSSIIGFLLETTSYFIFDWNGNSGILYGPWTPVYGIGAIIIISIYDFFNKKVKINKFLKLIFYFIIICILLSIIEFIGGYLIEFIFHESFWDYSDHKFNLGKYISLEMALVWGIVAIIFIYLIRPLIEKFIYLIPKFITYFITLLFIFDVLATTIIKVI